MSNTTVFATFDNADALQAALEVLRKNPLIGKNPSLRISTKTGIPYRYQRLHKLQQQSAFLWITFGTITAAIAGSVLVLKSVPAIAFQALVVNGLAWAVTGAVGGMLIWGLLDVLFNGSLDNRDYESEDERTFVISAEVSDDAAQDCMMKLLEEQGACKLERSVLSEKLPVQLFD